MALDGWMEGQMDGWLSRFKEFLQQSKKIYDTQHVKNSLRSTKTASSYATHSINVMFNLLFPNDLFAPSPERPINEEKGAYSLQIC